MLGGQCERGCLRGNINVLAASSHVQVLVYDLPAAYNTVVPAGRQTPKVFAQQTHTKHTPVVPACFLGGYLFYGCTDWEAGLLPRAQVNSPVVAVFLFPNHTNHF